MNRLFYTIILLLILDLLFQQCANPSSPTGGPKDTIPPTLTESYPVNGTLNFKEKEIRLVFSEYVTADNLKQKLIITPKTDITYKSIVKRNQLIIKFEGDFEDSTTYNLNFADAVTDITEKNPVINLSLAFSTGNYIDSMSIQGYIQDLFSQEDLEGYTVGLYPLTDSLDYFTQSPIYFATTNDSGNFKLNYLKTGVYKLLAFNDDNKNILLDPDTEAHGFIEEDIQLDSAININWPIRTLLQNVKPLTYINHRPAGPYVEIKFNKMLNHYQIDPDTFYHFLIGENKDAIRLYKPPHINYKDSTSIIVHATDTLNNQATDTIKVVFLESNRKPSELSYNIKSIEDYLLSNQQIEVNFNKPIIHFDSTKIFFSKDSTFSFPIKSSIEWNYNRTRLKLNTYFNKDSLLTTYQRSLPEDTVNIDTISDQSSSKSRSNSIRSIDFTIDEKAFVSVENDTTKKKTISIPINESTSFGSIKFTLNTTFESFNLQLLDRSGQVKYESKNQKQFTFPKVKAANYSIRVLIDSNNDGKWSAGNLLLNTEPEQIYLHPDETSVRENWVLEIDLFF